MVISIMLLSGAQLISLGVLGEYLARVYDEVKARPLYIVAEEIGFESPGDQRRPVEAEILSERLQRFEPLINC